MVQLKVRYTYRNAVDRTQFQFLMVQLKALIADERPPTERHFNSLWFN